VICFLCGEPVEPGERVAPGTWWIDGDTSRAPHVECALRSVMGGIGHHLDHELWCIERDDPDGGQSYRESALAVWRLSQGAGDC
jgi:hypothetical protein